MSITLISSDQQSFDVDRQVLKLSGTIETLIVNMNLDDAEVAKPIPLPNVKGDILKQMIDWCEHYKDDETKLKVDDDKIDVEIPGWDEDFLTALAVGPTKSPLLELCVAANYLDIKALLMVTCKKIANMLKGKKGEDIRGEWGVVNEFSAEEEEKIRRENEWTE